MKYLIALAAAISWAAGANAQAVVQSGAVTPYHGAAWTRNGVVADAGGPTTPVLNNLGLFNGSNCPLGVSSAPQPGSYGSAYSLLTICQTAAKTTFYVQGLNGQATPTVEFNIGGVIHPFPETDVGLTVGTTPIASGTTGRILYDNAGVLGEYSVTGSGNVVLGTSPTITSPTLTTPALGTPASGVLTNATGLPLTTGVTGVLPIANGGTNCSAASLTCFKNITGFTTAGTTGTTSTNLVFSTSPTLTTPALSAATVSTAATVTAGSDAQGQGALGNDYNVITTAAASPSGATLPTATVGRIVTVVNKGANTVNIYPATGAQIDGLGANSSIGLPATNIMVFYAASTTQWYSSYNYITATGSGSGTVTSVSLSGGTTGLTTSGSPVTTAGTLTLSGGQLVVANGGTGAATLTGLVVGNGTSAMTTVTAPSGVVVGTTDSQTLTNKTLTAPIIATISNTGTLTLPTSTTTLVGTDTTDTLTNKRVSPRVGTTASGATITPTGDSSDQYNVTALATDATIAAPSGTPSAGQRLIIRILDNGTPRALTWNVIYRAIGVTLPATTVANKTVYVGFIWNSASSTWDAVAVAQQS